MNRKIKILSAILLVLSIVIVAGCAGSAETNSGVPDNTTLSGTSQPGTGAPATAGNGNMIPSDGFVNGNHTPPADFGNGTLTPPDGFDMGNRTPPADFGNGTTMPRPERFNNTTRQE